jgi:hypothetical protein
MSAETPVEHGFKGWCGRLNPQGTKCQRIVSSQEGSDPFGNVSTLRCFVNQLQAAVVSRHDPICLVLSIELLQFYYSIPSAEPRRPLYLLTRAIAVMWRDPLLSSIAQVLPALSPILLVFAWSNKAHPDAQRIPEVRLEPPPKHH